MITDQQFRSAVCIVRNTNTHFCLAVILQVAAEQFAAHKPATDNNPGAIGRVACELVGRRCRLCSSDVMVPHLYVRLLQFLSCRKQCVPVTNCSRLLLFSFTIAALCENDAKHHHHYRRRRPHCDVALA